MMTKKRLSFWNIKVNHEDLCIILHFIIKVIKIIIKIFRTQKSKGENEKLQFRQPGDEHCHL